MAESKKFGTFGGVFTPSLLTILGVIMYMRMGWVVGNAGLVGTIIIIVIAHVISISTGLSISSIATDKKIGAGGVYYVLSRSLGLPIGGAIGLTLFAGTALSIALYLVGFAESLNSYFGIDPSINAIRITGTVALFALAAIALISTAVALKTQYFILAAIVVSLIAIFFGHSEFTPTEVPLFGGAGAASMEMVFAIFFPAVTGFTAGIAMSGDLKDSKKSIPQGTIAAIAVGFIVYIGLAFFIAYRVDAGVLNADNNILMKIAIAAPAVVAGIWGATLSSALGGILGGPRILQAMSVDRITPKVFSKGRGKDNEPWNALFLTVIIAEAGILIGELDMIARVVSMFYLAAYGVINISFFLESWASADFNPSFRVKRWVGLVGFIATFAVMFKLDMLAMIAAFVLIGGIYAWLQHKQLALGTGDIWQSVWSSVVKTGLRKMADKEDHIRNWKPNILLFSGSTDDRSHMLEFSRSLAGRSGVITNFDLLEDPDAEQLFPKHKQAVSDPVLARFGIFGRRIHVQNTFKGIESIASTFGFSGIEPNTVLMGWPRGTKDPIWFAQMTRKLIELDYNVLYLDYDERRGFGKREQVDLWWRGIDENAELMVNLARFISSSQDWSNATVRVLLVNEQSVETTLLRIQVTHLLETLRVSADVQVINNATERVPFYDLVKVHSANADLIFAGIPELAPDKVGTFAADTTELVSVIGTTLLVRSSSQFERTTEELVPSEGIVGSVEKIYLEPLAATLDPSISSALVTVDQRLEQAAQQFKQNTLDPIFAARRRMLERTGVLLLSLHDKLTKASSYSRLSALSAGIKEVELLHRKIQHEEAQALDELLAQGISQLLIERENILVDEPVKIRTVAHQGGKGQRIRWRKVLQAREVVLGSAGVRSALNELGLQELRVAHRISTDSSRFLRGMALAITREERQDPSSVLSQLKHDAEIALEDQKRVASAVPELVMHTIRRADRDLCNGIAHAEDTKALRGQHASFTTKVRRKEAQRNKAYIAGYAGYWSRNNILLRQQIATGNALTRLMIGIDDVAKNTVTRLRLEHLHGMQMHIKRIGNVVERTRAQLFKNDVDSIKSDEYHVEDDLFFNPDHVTEELSVRSGEVLSDVPDEVVLLSAIAINDFGEVQGEGVLTETMVLSKITDHLVETMFVNPLQAKMLKLGRQFDRVSLQVKSAVDLMRDAIERKADDDGKDRLTHAVDRSALEIADASKVLDLAWNNFSAELGNELDSLSETIEVRALIEQSTLLHARIKIAGKRRGFKQVLEVVSKEVGERLRKVSSLISRSERSVALAKFDQQHRRFRNEHVLVSDMMSKLTLTRGLAQLVPYHYQYLFSGKHLNVKRSLSNRDRELVEANKAIQRIKEGASGGIMILGGSLSGKTFFTEHIAGSLTGRVLRVKPSPGGATTRKALTIAFQEATGSSSLLDQQLTDLDAGATIILNDLEKWWSLEEGGQNAIEHLARMIERHGSRHVFLLNANLHAYELIQRTLSLRAALLSTITITPMTLGEIADEIWVRHRAGGMDLVLNGETVEEPDTKAFRKLVRRIHSASKGNVGTALRIWLAGIRSADDQTVSISAPSIVQFPDLDNASWKSMLYQFIIYRDIGLTRLYAIYRSEGSAWVDRQLGSLRRSGILDENDRRVYSLSPASRPFVEAWLKELRILE